MNRKQKSSVKMFTCFFAVIVLITFYNNITKQKIIEFQIPDNTGTSVLQTIDSSLVCTFQDGRVVSWSWDTHQQAVDFKAVSDRTIILNSQHLAAVSKEGKKMLTVYDLPGATRQKEFSVGWEDQELWLRIAPDKQTVALIRQNTPDSAGKILYEFLTADIEKDLTGSPATLSIQKDAEDFVDYALDNNSVLYALGSKDSTGRIAAIDLRKGVILWDRVFKNTEEFCSVMASTSGSAFYAGNRNGVLYKVNIDTGEIVKKIQLLEQGEKRPVTNDYSVLNLAFSPDGQYYVATINPKAYILKSDSDEVFHTFSPADRLVSKIAFSPDNKFVATSDVRAGYPIKIWPLPELK